MRFRSDYAKHKRHYVYCITHIPSGKKYVGQYNKNPEIRFLEHLTGYGNICIWELICAGESRDNFKFEILENNLSPDTIYESESRWVHELGCMFPYGLNAGFSSSFYTKYVKMRKQYLENGWCVLLLNSVIIDKQTNTTTVQDWIDILVKNQTADVNMMSHGEMESWRKNRRRGYSRVNVFKTKDMSNFFAAREKEYERVRSGNFTEAEIAAKNTRSDHMKTVWSQRNKEERVKILKNATEMAAIKNRKHEN